MFQTIAKPFYEAKELAASAEEFKGKVQAGLEELVAGALRDGETAPDLVFFQEILGRLLLTGCDQLSAIDDSYTVSRMTSAQLRDKRDELRDRLRELMVPIRLMLDLQRSDSAVKAALRDRRFSSAKPADLVFSARNLVAILRDPKVGLEGQEGPTFKAASTLANTVEEVAAELTEVLNQLSPERRANQNSQGVKADEVDSAVTANRRCGNVLLALYRLCGLDYHADRLRQRVRVKRRSDEQGMVPSEVPPTQALQVTN